MTGRLVTGDCVAGLGRLPAGCVDLAFADPPFNIGYRYDVYRDRRPYGEYLSWSRTWMAAVCRVLKPAGTFWVAIGDEYAAELAVIARRDLGLTRLGWIVWYYTFGVNCTRKFSRSHTHLLYFVKDPRRCTFNRPERPAHRAAGGERRPPGWILRPHDVPGGFSADQDTWYFPRVAGTFKERAGFHGCQMPEQLLGRIIRCCSNPGDLVLDPFAGSGTTLVVAKKLGRRWLGFELSEQYAVRARERVAAAGVGQPLAGAADPLASAPRTRRRPRRPA